MRLFFATAILCLCAPAIGQDTPLVPPDPGPETMVQFRFMDKNGSERTIAGRVLIEAVDGGVLVEDRAGTYWNITPQQMKEQVDTDTVFTPLDKDERISQLKDEFGVAFEIRSTDSYLICSNAGPAYTEWCGDLLQRYQSAFIDYWEETGLKLAPLPQQLVVIILSNKTQFDDFYQRDVGQKTQSSFGFYSIRKNRVVLYDFASPDGTSDDDRRQQTVRSIQKAVKKVPFNVATIIHEATHQLAFNTGIHTRYADNPVWLTEGIAMYFESADSGTGTRKPRIGKSNPLRKKSLKPYLNNISADSIRTLIASDDRFRSSEVAGNAYTEAWAFTTYLMKRKPDQLIQFIKSNQKNARLIWKKPDERQASFEAAFGPPDDFEKLMLSYLKRLR
ncbi:MAG: DUF1570 domain-containing protein [Planctomycetaceae bacterium]